MPSMCIVWNGFVGSCDATATTFVQEFMNIIRSHGSQSLALYKLLASTMDLSSVKKVDLIVKDMSEPVGF